MNDYELAKYHARIERARGPFQAACRFMHLRNWGHNVPAARRIVEAQTAVREWRDANGQGRNTSDDIALAVRIAADQFAEEITAAGHEYDPATIAWVLAGLRCPSRPFCTGCDGCFTITAPERHYVRSTPPEGTTP